MQKLPGIIKIENGKGKWCDINGTPGAIPRITLALAAQLVIDLRSSRFALPEKPDLAPYPLDEVAGSASFYVAVDSDYDQLTIPPIIRTSGINAAQDADGATVLTVALPLLDSPELRDAVKTGAEVLLKAEIGGLNADGQTVFVVQFPLILQNRVYIPDGSGSPETPDPSDPEYLTTTQVKAYINTELAAAVAALELPEGEPGPMPDLSVGTVQAGTSAAVEIVPAGEGAYLINLTLPKAADGATPTPITPQISIGAVQAGSAASASLEPVAETPGAFILNLTLPRGSDGAGVTPRGQWAAETSYNQHDAVRHASAWWRSLHGDNLGNEPPATRIDDAHWEIIVKDGTSADPLVVTYNDTDNPNDPDWHLHRRATDKYYRWTTDGGRTFTEAALLTQAAIAPILRFNQDATTDWRNLPAAAGTNNYHSVIGKYCRIKTSGGVWGDAKKVHELNASESYRVQFGATPPEGAIDPDTGAPLEPDWHANFLPGDDRIIFYNLSGTIRLDVKVTLPEGEEIGGVQFCAIADPWHADYAEGDRFRKISMDGGATYSQPIPLYGKSTYEEWLAAGNTGAPEEFLDSLKGVEWPAGGSPGKVLMYGPSGPTWGSLAEYTPIPQPVEPPSPEDLGLIDLPDGVEKRIWRHLCVRRPNEGRDLHLFWQTSMNGVQWGTLYSSATHPHCVATRGAGGEPIAFTTEYGPAMLPVEFIPVLDIHVRTCWGYLDGENVWHKGDWTYHNTLGVRLSLEGLPLEKPDYFNPEYFLIPIPDGTDQCEIRLSTDDDFRGKEVLFSNTLYSSEAKGFFFDGQNLLPATQETVESLPVPFNAAAFEGQWFVFKRRGIAKYNIRAVWTGDNPVIYVWSPEKAYEQEA